MIVVDATDQILGRMASKVAKLLMEGESITVVNSEKAVITGNSKRTIEKYRKRYDLSRAVNPRKGPFYPRMPDRIMSRTIRGMLPWSKSKGKEAFRRLRVYRGMPDSLKDSEFTTFDEAAADRLKTRKFITVQDIANELGANKGMAS